MIEVILWNYIKIKPNRIVRLEKKIELSVRPSVGDEISLKDDYQTIGRVMLIEGGGIVAICEMDTEASDVELATGSIRKLVEEDGWKIISDVTKANKP